MKKPILLFILILVQQGLAQSFSKYTSSAFSQTFSDTRSILVTDLDNNSYPDIYALNRPSAAHEFYMNFGDTLLPINSSNALSAVIRLSGGFSSGDLNGDCLPDVFYANGSGGNGSQSISNSLYENTGSNFLLKSSTGATNFNARSNSATMVDYDGDGDLDIYVSNDNSTFNELYRNDNNFSFQKIDTIGITNFNTITRNPAWCDYDNDGDLDLFLCANGPNLLFRNDDTAFFQITTGSIVTDNSSSASAAWGDYDGDGYMDLYVANFENSFPSPQNFLYRNLGNGTFQKITTGIASTKRGKTIGVLWLDVDNDGDLDIFASGAHSSGILRENDLYINNGNGTFSEHTSGSLVSDLSNNTGTAAADIDKDGDVDIVLGYRQGQNEIYLNDLNGAANFISFNILGTNGKANAYNAKVKLKCNFNGTSRWEYRRILPNSGNGQSSPILHYGTGSATTVDSVVIEWLGGPTCTFTNLASNKFYNVDPLGCRIDTILTTEFKDSVNFLAAQFTDQSGGDIIRWHWDFGDGDSSNLQNPIHNYATAGDYQVCLTTYDSYCKWDSSCTILSICPDTASIGFSSHSVGTTVTFTDTSSLDGYHYVWAFGDGNFGSGKNPVHTYLTNGEYVVCIAITDSCRTKSFCDTITVCNANLLASFGTSIATQTASFTDSSINADTIYWDFGDGNSSTAPNPTHTYATPGFYIVCQTVVDFCNTTTFCDTIGICVDTAVAGFNFTSTNQLFNFSSTSVNANTYAWDFGDGNSSTQQNPAHIYSALGVYKVCLVVSNDCYTDTFCQNVAICNLNPLASFSYQATSTPLAIQFSDQSQDAQLFSWDFGDGSTSTNQNPIKVFSSRNVFNVCLTITDSCGTSDSTCQILNLIDFALADSWLGNLQVYPNPSPGKVNITSPLLQNRNLSIQAFDLNGRSILSREIQNSDSELQIDLSNQPRGLYLLKISEGENLRMIKISRY